MSKSKTPASEKTNPVHTPCGFISDGYSLPFEIPEQPGISCGLSGKYRPLPNRELQTLFALNRASSHKIPATLPNGQTAAEYLERLIDGINAKAIASRLVEWDLVDDQGEPVPINAENVSLVYPARLLSDLTRVVCSSYVAPKILDTQTLDAILSADCEDSVKVQAIRDMIAAAKDTSENERNDAKN